MRLCLCYYLLTFSRLVLYYSNFNLFQSLCVQVLSKEKQILLWVVFNNSVQEGYLACNPIYSKLLGFEEGLEVFVVPYGDVKILDELFIDTDSPDDQEILVRTTLLCI